MNAPRTKRPALALVVQGIRVAIVGGLLLLIPEPTGTAVTAPDQRPDIELVRRLLPTVGCLTP